MLKITFRPQEDAQQQGPVSPEWNTPVLTLSETDYDLSELPDGATASHPELGQVSRNGDDYTVSIILRYRYGAPAETTDPQPITMTEDGAVPLPPYEAPPQDEQEPTP